MSNQATGPRTEAGKERSSMNAVKHGLRAQTIVLPHENAEEWEALRQATHEQYRPQGLVETELVERIAVTLWRLRRAALYEVDAFEAEDRDKALANVIRYEAHLSRQLNQALKILRDEQDNGFLRRMGRPEVPPSATKQEQEQEPMSSFGTTTAERSSFGNRAEEIIAQRLLELAEVDRKLKDLQAPARSAAVAATR